MISPRCLRIRSAVSACFSSAARERDFGGSRNSTSFSRSRNRSSASRLVQFVPPTLQISRRTTLPLLLFRPCVAHRKSVEGWGGFAPRSLGRRFAARASDRHSSSRRFVKSIVIIHLGQKALAGSLVKRAPGGRDAGAGTPGVLARFPPVVTPEHGGWRPRMPVDDAFPASPCPRMHKGLLNYRIRQRQDSAISVGLLSP